MNIFLIFFIISFLLNVYLFLSYLKKKEKQKALMFNFNAKIPRVLLNQVDKIFEPNEFGVTLATQVQYIGRGNIEIVGGTSDSEAWILAVLSKNAKKMFEFGTCTGKTSYLWAVNSPSDAHIYTLTLSPEQLNAYTKANKNDDTDLTQIALKESQFTKFMYNNTPVEHKVTQIFNDSKLFDTQLYKEQMDLIFIDGSHAYSYVMSDTQKALEMLAPNGILLWHDFRGNNEVPDVYKAIHELGKKLSLVHIAGTSLVAYRKIKN
jgi:predicted O-methyltransferase YrrM